MSIGRADVVAVLVAIGWLVGSPSLAQVDQELGSPPTPRVGSGESSPADGRPPPTTVTADEAEAAQTETAVRADPSTPPATKQLEPAPPKGPADIIRRSAASREAARLPGSGSAASPHAGAFEAPPSAAAAPDPELPVGTVAISVLDGSGAPVSDARLSLAILAAQGGRQERRARTDADGLSSFEQLATGTEQAYRVNLMYEGAKVSSSPFRLPTDTGYRVTLRQLPTTTDPRFLFQMLAQVAVELQEGRLRISQQSRLTNVGNAVYVFPKEGELIRLPEDYVSFQFQEVMTDQRFEERDGQGFVLKGSIPPGTVTLTWTFDVPLAGSEQSVKAPVPWPTYLLRVFSDAPEGLSFDVRGMPPPQRVEEPGRAVWITQQQAQPGEARRSAVTLRLSGIPGPGPGRWIALSLSLFALGFGVWALWIPGQGEAQRREAMAARRAALLECVQDLDAQKERGELGPEYYRERLDELTTALAVVLRDEELLAERSASG